jgi:hypothetical protein
MSEQLKARVFFDEKDEDGRVFSFVKAKDGWWENKDNFLIINPDLSKCSETVFCMADFQEAIPHYRFEILK